MDPLPGARSPQPAAEHEDDPRQNQGTKGPASEGNSTITLSPGDTSSLAGSA